jgi:osmotically-inducible protein OsmY
MKTDKEIQDDVIAEMSWDPILKATEVGVAVKNGVVTLSGTLNSYAKKVAAEKAAKRVAGVRAVAEDIEVKYGREVEKNDSELADTILLAFKIQNISDPDKLKIKVEDGIVTLEGEVSWKYQKNTLASIVSTIHGVNGINNLITIKPAIMPDDLKKQLRAAFHRSATIDSSKIDFEINGTIVTIKGKVRSWAEMNDAENAVWKSPGVSKVVNGLSIQPE